jgi:hypothetical protein
MRKRRKSISNLLFFAVGLLLLVGCALAILPLVVGRGWLNPGWDERAGLLLDVIREWLPTDEQLRFLAWLAGIAASAIGAGLTLLASWHFSEMNLPRRLEDLTQSMLRSARAQQPPFLALARAGLGPVLPDIEASRFTLLRRWLSSWSERERARVLAASHNILAREARLLTTALREAQQQQITAHLIRGYQHVSQGEDEQASDEFDAATRVHADEIVSRDIAAGWARRVNNQQREFELLKEMQEAAIRVRQPLQHARALRREAELLTSHQNDRDRLTALRMLRNASNLLQALLRDEEARIELGRILTVFCELRCEAGHPGRLNTMLATMRACMTGVDMHRRPEEPDGEEYGKERAEEVERRVTALINNASDPK